MAIRVLHQVALVQQELARRGADLELQKRRDRGSVLLQAVGGRLQNPIGGAVVDDRISNVRSPARLDLAVVREQLNEEVVVEGGA